MSFSAKRIIFSIIILATAVSDAQNVFKCDFSGPYYQAGENQKDIIQKNCSNNYEWGKKDIDISIVKNQDGSSSQLFDIKSISSGAMQFFVKGFQVWRSKYYRVSFRMKAESFSGPVRAQIRRIAHPWTVYVKGISFFPDSEWKTYSFTGPGLEDADHNGFGVMFESGSVGKIYISDVKVEEFPSNPDAGKKERELVRGNLIPRSSYEGERDYFWTSGIYAGANPDAEFDDPQIFRAPDGKFGSFCMGFSSPERYGKTFARSYYMPVRVGQNYIFSFWMKNDREGAKLTSSILSPDTMKKQAPLVSKSFSASKDWKRFSISVKIPEQIYDVYIDFSTPAGNGTFMLDGFQFEAADKISDYSPAYPYELCLSTGSQDKRILFHNETLKFKINASSALSNTASNPLSAILKIIGYPDRLISEEKLILKPGESIEREIKPGVNGIFRMELIPENKKDAASQEMIMARVPVPRDTGAESFFGTHITVRPFFIDYAKKAGFKWIRLHDGCTLAKWNIGEAKKDSFKFYDREVDAMKSAGLFILGLPDSSSVPSWASEPDADGNIFNLAAFSTYCRILAAHYKGRIDFWEVWNEPYMKYFFKGTPQQFSDVFIAGAKGLKEGNPNARTLGICSEINDISFIKSVGSKVWNYADIMSFHLYFQNITGDGKHNFGDEIAELKKALSKNCPNEFWNSEGANRELGSNSFYSFQNIDPKLNENAVAFASRVWIESAQSGISKTFIYTIHQSDTLIHSGELKMLIGFDRSMTPSAVSNAVCAWAIDGLKYSHSPQKSGVKQALFKGRDRQTLAIYKDQNIPGRTKLNLSKIPESWQISDSMGNIPSKSSDSIEIDISPVFIIAPPEEQKFAEICQSSLFTE